MNKTRLVALITVLLTIGTVFGHKIHKRDVPSVIINSFHKHFPRAYDVEWKMEQNIYKVEFETGLRRNDHTIWFDNLGKIVRHKEEISKNKLPTQIIKKIDTDFGGYRISDVKRISEDNSVIYTLELKRFNEEWKVSFNPDGSIISKIPD